MSFVKTLFGPRVVVTRLDAPPPPPVEPESGEELEGPEPRKRKRKAKGASEADNYLVLGLPPTGFADSRELARGRVDVIGFDKAEEGGEWADVIGAESSPGSEFAAMMKQAMSIFMRLQAGVVAGVLPSLRVGEVIIYQQYRATALPDSPKQFVVDAAGILAIVDDQTPLLSGIGGDPNG